jgi:hypothetical protein
LITLSQPELERKRHIGNDVVVIVFLDGDTPFHPKSIASHYTRMGFSLSVSSLHRESGFGL